MLARHSQCRFNDAYGKGLAAIAQISHVVRFGMVEFSGRVFAVGRDKAVEVVLYGFEMRLAVPKGVIGIEGNDP